MHKCPWHKEMVKPNDHYHTHLGLTLSPDWLHTIDPLFSGSGKPFVKTLEGWRYMFWYWNIHIIYLLTSFQTSFPLNYILQGTWILRFRCRGGFLFVHKTACRSVPSKSPFGGLWTELIWCFGTILSPPKRTLQLVIFKCFSTAIGPWEVGIPSFPTAAILAPRAYKSSSGAWTWHAVPGRFNIIASETLGKLLEFLNLNYRELGDSHTFCHHLGGDQPAEALQFHVLETFGLDRTPQGWKYMANSNDQVD